LCKVIKNNSRRQRVDESLCIYSALIKCNSIEKEQLKQCQQTSGRRLAKSCEASLDLMPIGESQGNRTVNQ